MSSKSKTRKSPEQSATLYNIGTIKKGLDFNKWIITETIKGIKRWKRIKSNNPKSKSKSKSKSKLNLSRSNNINSNLSKPKTTKSKSYKVHDNGGRPFKVTIEPSVVSIYTYKDNNCENPVYNKLIAKFQNPVKIWIGKDKSNGKSFDGNSILLQINSLEYVFVGEEIYKFQLAEKNEKIKKYISRVGNSDVPYPYIVTNKNVYFMIENVYASQVYYNKEDLYVNEPYEKHYNLKKDKTYKTYKLKSRKVIKKRMF